MLQLTRTMMQYTLDKSCQLCSCSPNALWLHLAESMLSADAAFLVSSPLIHEGLNVCQDLLVILGCKRQPCYQIVLPYLAG